MKFYQAIAHTLVALETCKAWDKDKRPGDYKAVIEKHQNTLDTMADLLPSGSGFDNGTIIEGTNGERLVFGTDGKLTD